MKQYILGADAPKATVIRIGWPPEAEGVFKVDKDAHRELFEVAEKLVGGRKVSTIAIFATDEEKED